MISWGAIVAIVAIIAFAASQIVKYWALGRSSAPSQPFADPQREELEREVSDLKKRLAVLERIATDDRQSKAIAHEIEALRDR